MPNQSIAGERASGLFYDARSHSGPVCAGLNRIHLRARELIRSADIELRRIGVVYSVGGALVLVAGLLPIWVVLFHNALYITVWFVWLLFADDGAAGEESTIRQNHHSYRYQLPAMLCSLTFADNLLGRIEGHGATVWFLPSPGRWELIFVSGVLSVLCQLLFWRRVVPPGNR